MNTTLTQLMQWPPTTTTVIGVGLLLGLISYKITGSWEWAIAAAGLFKTLCPEDAPVTDQVLTALGKIPIKGALLLALGLGLAGCGTAPPNQEIAKVAQAIQPRLLPACNAAMELSPIAGPYAPFIVAGCGSAEAIDKLAADPSSTEWVNKLVADAKGLKP